MLCPPYIITSSHCGQKGTGHTSEQWNNEYAKMWGACRFLWNSKLLGDALFLGGDHQLERRMNFSAPIDLLKLRLLHDPKNQLFLMESSFISCKSHQQQQKTSMHWILCKQARFVQWLWNQNRLISKEVQCLSSNPKPSCTCYEWAMARCLISCSHQQSIQHLRSSG